MRVITFLNQKGGVGKTSTCHHLAGTLARDGRRVLLIDNDPQASLTQGLLGPDITRSLDPSKTVASIYRGDQPYPGVVIRPTHVAGIDLLPGSSAAKTFNRPDAHVEKRPLRLCLREFLSEVRQAYDYALIDVPPNLHLCSWAALAASHHIVVPLQPEDYGSQGISDVRDSIRTVGDSDNPDLSLLGYLITRANLRKAVHRMFDESLRDLYSSQVFATVIPDSVDFVEAITARKPVIQHKPRGAAARSIRELADEFYQRMAPAAIREVA